MPDILGQKAQHVARADHLAGGQVGRPVVEVRVVVPLATRAQHPHLSAAEAALLQSLLKRPNKILTREQLIGERELDPFDRSIDVRISRLRRKLEDDPQDPKIIKTVYGAGYLLCGTVEWVTG